MDQERDRIEETSAERQFKLAKVWHQRGKLLQARSSYQKAVELDPSHIDSRLGLGKALEELGLKKEAVEFYRSSLLEHPNEAEFHKGFISLMDSAGLLEEAYNFYHLERVDTRPIEVRDGSLLCCLVVRNEITRLPFFLKYYREKKVDRFLIIDNESADGTSDYLISQPDVYVWKSDSSFNLVNFGSVWFELLLRKYGRGHWCLTVDTDEILYYEGCETRSLADLCRRLEKKGKRVFEAILLEMYSSRPIRETRYAAGEDPRKLCGYFDKKFFHSKYRKAGPYKNHTFYFGGARERVFGPDESFCLSKVALIKYDLDCILAGGQHWTNLPSHLIARESGCLLHFKYTSNFHEQVAEQVERKEHYGEAAQYRAYQMSLSKNTDLSFYDPACSVKLRDSKQLIELGVMRADTEDGQNSSRLQRIGPPIKILDDTTCKRPFWSVMITVYDRTRWLKRALMSVVSQARDAHHMQIEVILDGPNSEIRRQVQRILEEIGGDRVTFTAIEHNLGHPSIFNYCIDQAVGDWIHILHDDDYLVPGFYAALENGLKMQPEVGAAFCRHTEMDSQGRQHWTSWLEKERPGVIDDWLERIGVSCRLAFSSMVVKREVYEALGGFSGEVGSAFDWEMWKRIATSYPVWFEPKVLVYCCKQGDSLTEKLIPSGRQIADSLEAVEFSKMYLPPDTADSISAEAKEHHARYALDLARAQLRNNEYEAAVLNIEQGLKASRSEVTRKQLVSLLAEVER